MVEQWFAVQSGSTRTGGLRKVHELMEHPAFDWKNPNKIRSVIGVFAGQNLPAFHAEDGAGYQFLAEQVRKLDDSNPQIAARLVSPLTRWRKFAPVHGEQMKSALETVRDKSGLSAGCLRGGSQEPCRPIGKRDSWGIRLPQRGACHRRIQNRTFGR